MPIGFEAGFKDQAARRGDTDIFKHELQVQQDSVVAYLHLTESNTEGRYSFPTLCEGTGWKGGGMFRALPYSGSRHIFHIVYRRSQHRQTLPPPQWQPITQW